MDTTELATRGVEFEKWMCLLFPCSDCFIGLIVVRSGFGSWEEQNLTSTPLGPDSLWVYPISSPVSNGSEAAGAWKWPLTNMYVGGEEAKNESEFKCGARTRSSCAMRSQVSRVNTIL